MSPSSAFWAETNTPMGVLNKRYYAALVKDATKLSQNISDIFLVMNYGLIQRVWASDGRIGTVYILTLFLLRLLFLHWYSWWTSRKIEAFLIRSIITYVNILRVKYLFISLAGPLKGRWVGNCPLAMSCSLRECHLPCCQWEQGRWHLCKLSLQASP